MNVASLELCRTLHELSGWVDDAIDQVYVMPGDGLTQYEAPVLSVEIPAYDLGYLLRKLREQMYLPLSITARDDGFEFSLQRAGGAIWLEADTLENNACKLAIELLKRDILKKSD